MTSELWIGIFIVGVIVMVWFFLIVLMWAITARSSQISRWEEFMNQSIDDHLRYGENFIEISRTEKNYDPRSPDGLSGGTYIGPDDLVFRDKEGVVHIDSLSRPEPIPPDHDVKSS